MQIRSNLWKELAASGNVKMETAVVIDGHEYAPKSDVTISRTLGQNALSIGNTITATVQFSIEAADGVEIPDVSAAVVKIRYVDSERASEWLTVGTFYVSRRQKDVVSEILDFQGYDAMIRADAPFPSLSGFPKAMNSVVMEIAHNMGVEVDTRTWTDFPTGNDYYVPLPANGEKMIKVLGYIGGVCGGNWIITPLGKLRLVPLASASGAASAVDKADIVGILERITVGKPATVTGVVMSGQNSVLVGNSDGAVISVASNPYMTRDLLNALLTRYNGFVYMPFSIGKGIYDPAVEIGDYIISREDVAGVVWQETARYSPMFRGDLSAPFLSETSGSGQSISDVISDTSGEYEDLSVRFYKFNNKSAVTVADGQSAEIINFDYAAGVKQDVIFHAEVCHITETTETGNASDGWTVGDAVLTVTYYINGKAVETRRPKKAETDGDNILHLNYHWKNGRYSFGNFRVVLGLSGGSVAIAEGDALAYIIGQGHSGAYDADSAYGLKSIIISSYPYKRIYTLVEKLDLDGLAVKAEYGDGTEIDVTRRCVFDPKNGASLEEGVTDVDVTYAEEDTKPFTTSFPVFCVGENGGLKTVLLVEYPSKRLYDIGEQFTTAGAVVKAFYGDGTEENVTESCIFQPANGDLLPNGKSYVTVTYGEEQIAEFSVYCGDGDYAWLAHPPTKLTYFLNDLFETAGAVAMARKNGVEAIVTEDCTFNPENGERLQTVGKIAGGVEYEGEPLDEFYIYCGAGNSEHGWVLWVWIDTLPNKLNYVFDVEGENTLDLTGIVIKALFGDMEEAIVTEDCTFNPENGAELARGDNPINATYPGTDPMSFTVYCGGRSNDLWITEDGLMFIGVESYPDKMNYEYDETLDLTGLVIKAYYADGNEKNITEQCTVTPAHGAELEEGENVINISYTEDGKTFLDSFSVYSNGDGYRVLYIEVEQPPDKTEYFLGETLDLTGIVIAAVQEDGWAIRNIKPQCTFSPAEGDVLTEPGTVTVTVTRRYLFPLDYGTFTAYFDVAVKTVRIMSYPTKTDYVVGDTLDYTGLEVYEALADGTTRDVTSECVLLPAGGTEVTKAGDIMVDVRYHDKSLGTFWVSVVEAEIIDGGEWWTLSNNGLLDVYCVGDMPLIIDPPNNDVPWYEYNRQITDVTIRDSVTDILSHSFENCVNLTNIIIPDSITIIGSSAFAKSGLTSVTIPNSVTFINGNSFMSCKSLVSATLSSGMTWIDEQLFYECSNLAYVTIPDSVKRILRSAFSQCDSLTDIYYSGTEEQWNTITIEGGNTPLLNATIHYNSTGPT